MSRLIVLSNRVKMPDNTPMAGGLAIALHDVLRGGSVIWMGWNGEVGAASNGDYSHEFNSSEQSALAKSERANANGQEANLTITYMTTALTPEQHQHFYCGFANNVLWPLLHEQTDLISQESEDYLGYQSVNLLFARQLKKIIQPDDVIWVHDYHFLSVAYYCRQLGMRNRIGFFLHIPFVALPFWQALDQSAELIRHLAHYDVLGTQTQLDKANCVAVFQHYLADDIVKDEQSVAFYNQLPSTKAGSALLFNLQLGAPHCLAINAYPIGVNVLRIQQHVMSLANHLPSYSTNHSKKHHREKNAIKPAAQQIIAVDRIDYSKGLLKRISAYRKFLQQYPVYQHQLKLLQIACPSRLDLPVYQQLYSNVKQSVHDLNQYFSSRQSHQEAMKADSFDAEAIQKNWQAISYSETVVSQEALMRAYWHSDVGWVNSFKDGMNLVAKEYIAAQNPDNPGVLLLSRYAGAAEQMQAAVIIDPHTPQSIINGLQTALTMPLAERKSRYQTLLQGLEKDDLYAWQQHFLKDLYDSKNYQTAGLPLATSQTDQMSGS